jgi:dihydrolipoamide dehydrogenase
MKKNKIEVISGAAKLLGNGKLEVNGETLSAKSIIISTGARARELPNIKPDGEHIVTYKDAMVPEKMPKSLMVIGSGAIGIEFASFYNMLGADVTIVEIMPRILNAEDEEISKFAHKSFEKQGIKIHNETQVVEAVTKNKKVEVKLKYKDGKISTQTFDKVISAAGIVPNTENLGLEKTKIKFEKGFIKAEVIKYNDYAELGSEQKCKEAGKLGIEGKSYIVGDGDVMHFRFNV